MKIERLFIYSLLATTCLFTACDNEMTADGDGACTPLPEGMYPLTLTATQTGDEVQTRVSENSDGTSSAWTNGDEIKVKITDNGNDAETTCTLDASGQVTAYNPELFWKTNGTSTVTAWYPTDGTVNLANQRDGLKYVLKATATGASYKSNVALSFAHQLAKVRVKLTGEKASEVTSVGIKGYTSCTVTNGNVTGSGDGYISMQKNTYNGEIYWEANLVPQSVKGTGLIQLNGNNAVDVTGISQWDAGSYHTLTIKAGPILVTGGEITEPGEYIMKGTVNQTVTLKGDGITLTLDGVTANTDNAIKVAGGSPTIIVKGINYLTSTGGPGIWVDGESTNVKITGDGSTKSSLIIQSNSAAIGTKGNNYNCGNITIEKIKIEATTGDGDAAIGFGFGYGAGSSQKIGNITIIDSEIQATLSENPGLADYGAVIGGCGSGEGTFQIGDITIKTSDISTTPYTYFQNCTCGDVLVGFPPSPIYGGTCNAFKIFWNGQEQSGNITK